MTTPEGEGINTDDRPITLPYWYVTGNDGTIPGLEDRTQDIVTATLQNFVKDSPNWTASSTALWSGLGFRPGIPWASAALEWLANALGFGTVFSSMEEMWDAFNLWGLDIPQLEDIIEAITGIEGGDYEDLANWALGVLTDLSPLNAFNLFGTIQPDVLGLIPFSHIAQDQPNLLTAPGFDYAENISGGAVWTWDAAEGRTTPGCVTVHPNGADQRLVSNEILVAVASTDQQKMTFSAWLKWSGLTFTGTPLRLQVVRYLGGVIQGTDNLAAPVLPGANQTSWLQLSGSYDVPDGCDAVRLQFYVASTATAGQIWWDDAEARKTSLLQMDWTSGLPENLQGLAQNFQDIIDSVWQSMIMTGEVGKTLEEMMAALQQIPGFNVLGYGGPDNMQNTFQASWDQLIGGMVGESGTGSSLASLFNVSFQVSSWASLGRMGWDILGIRNNQSLFTGFPQTSTSNMSMASLGFTKNTSGTPTAPTVPITQTTALTGWHRVAQAMDIGYIGFTGSYSGSPTAFYMNIWRMDDATGDITCIHHSTNQLGQLGTSINDIAYTFSPLVELEAADLIGIELHIVGGTLNAVGDTTWRNFNHPNVVPRRWSSVRNAGTSSATPGNIASASVDYNTTNVPYTEYGVSAGSLALPHGAETRTFNTAGSFTTPIPTWSRYIDIIALGGGGGGEGDAFPVWGEGGWGGHYATATKERGVSISNAATQLNITVGGGGAGGDSDSGWDGANGGNSSVTATGMTTVTAAGGAGGSARNLDTPGKSPGNQTYNGTTYIGGAEQTVQSQNGNAPGGGGAGSKVSAVNGGTGARGAVVIVFRQT